MPNKFAAGDKMLKHEQIQITLSPFQLEYISKMEAHGYSREEVIHRALNELMAKDDKVSGCHLPIGEYSQQKNNNMILVEGGSIAPIPSFQAVLSSFWLSRYPVTQAEFKEVMGITPSHDFGLGPSYPAYYLSWFNTLEYCNRRSLKDGLSPCYSYKGFGVNPDDWPEGWDQEIANQEQIECAWNANGYRLPTEMEWMFAASGGCKTRHYQFSGSDLVDEVAWHVGNWGERSYSSHTVGAKAPNELGLYDMSGNVWELCWDRFGSYPQGTLNNPTGPTTGNNRVRRGGAWYYNASLCTITTRAETQAIDRGPCMGFRVCRRDELSLD